MMPIPVHDFPPSLQLCGERVPLERLDVWEMMDQSFVLSVYNQEQVILWIKRANRYFPYIEKRLRERKMPDDIKYVAVVESSLRTYAVSSAKATGPWQFMEKTAKRYGLGVDSTIDERLNFERATEAALNYLDELHRLFGNWGLAIAAYNCGEDRVAKSIEMQGVSNYYDADLPLETERYIFRILAAPILILAEPERYGYRVSALRVYPVVETDRIEIHSGPRRAHQCDCPRLRDYVQDDPRDETRSQMRIPPPGPLQPEGPCGRSKRVLRKLREIPLPGDTQERLEEENVTRVWRWVLGFG